MMDGIGDAMRMAAMRRDAMLLVVGLQSTDGRTDLGQLGDVIGRGSLAGGVV